MTFREILEANGVEVVEAGQHHHARPGFINFDCPFCGKGSGKYHMGYSIGKKYCSCWRCRGHSVIDTLMEVTGGEYRDVKKLLTDSDSLGTTEAVNKRGKLILPYPLQALGKAHQRYLSKRFADAAEIARRWDLQGLFDLARVRVSPEQRIKLAWRVFIPIKLNGKVVSWTTRAISDDAALRYISAPAECEEINHKTLLYGEDFVSHAVCCVEGPFDAMRIGPGAVASCGVGFSQAQVLRLSRYPVRGVCFDAEPAAQRRAQELVDLLSAFEGETFNIQIDSKDPGCATDSEVATIRKTLGL
jgi:hypothetical protein